MPLDDEVMKALEETVTKNGQPASVAKRIAAWLEDMSDGDVNQDSMLRHFDSVRNAIKLTTVEELDEN